MHPSGVIGTVIDTIIDPVVPGCRACGGGAILDRACEHYIL